MESIPPDVIAEILARLPVRNLVRFRCVSKCFKSLIHSPDFIKLQLSHPNEIKTDLYGIFEWFEFECLRIFHLSKSIHIVAVERIKPPPGFKPAEADQWYVVGTCNGLVALRNRFRYCSTKSDMDFDFDFNILLWNPLTGKFKELASCLVPNTQISFGFGYDPKSDDYKLVKIAAFSGSGSGVTIYSLKSNSWKEMCNEWSLTRENSVWQNGGGVLANNALHWLIRDEIMKIVVFDLVKEEFYLMPVLESFQCHHGMELSVLDGRLTLSTNYENSSHVWVMKEAKESWTKLLHFDRPSEPGYWLRDHSGVIPLAYSSDRDRILLNHKGDVCDLFWCDLSTEEAEPCLYVKEVSRKGDVKTFVGSLVALGESNDEVDSNGRTKKRRRISGGTQGEKRNERKITKQPRRAKIR